MILVAVGSSHFPFDRLLRAVDDLPRDETMFVQHGPSTIRPARAECVPFMPFDALVERVREARVVVTHAGVGSILLSLAHGKRPFVVPRLRALGETVDDHQVESAQRFASAGLVTLVEDVDRLRDVLSETSGREFGVEHGGADLRIELRTYLDEVLAR